MQHNIDTDLRFSIVPEWVLDAKVSDRAIRIYSILARYADNETLQAFPSRETLAQRAHCSAKAVTKAIHELVAIGAVLKQHRKHGDSYQSNLYTLRRVGPISTLPRDTDDPTLGSDLTPPRVTDGSLTITTELEPQNVEPENDINEQFNDFWAVYPRKKGKGQARRAFEKALEKTDLDTILAGVAAYVANEDMDDPQFIAHPSTWLNGERWEDEYEEPKIVATPTPERRGWVRDFHDAGDHWECRPGEFGCK